MLIYSNELSSNEPTWVGFGSEWQRRRENMRVSREPEADWLLAQDSLLFRFVCTRVVFRQVCSCTCVCKTCLLIGCRKLLWEEISSCSSLIESSWFTSECWTYRLNMKKKDMKSGSFGVLNVFDLHQRADRITSMRKRDVFSLWERLKSVCIYEIYAACLEGTILFMAFISVTDGVKRLTISATHTDL